MTTAILSIIGILLAAVAALVAGYGLRGRFRWSALRSTSILAWRALWSVIACCRVLQQVAAVRAAIYSAEFARILPDRNAAQHLCCPPSAWAAP